MENPNRSGAGNLRVLMQNRATARSHPGGDTVYMDRLADGLRRLGAQVTIDCGGTQSPRGFDIVHIFNFVLAKETRAYAEKAKAEGVPFVVTTLYEDVPLFHNQSIVTWQWLAGYIQSGQKREWLHANREARNAVTPAPRIENGWTAENAAALLTTGAGEAETIRRDYPRAAPTFDIPVGITTNMTANPQLFQSQYGVRDYILCVGRIETRKNQLMLLAALEDVETPVVLAAGGFSYQDEYLAAVKKFQRRGKTVIADRLSDEMLASAYAGARVHALPSWYELPGIVSLEAGAYGCNVVATDRGSTRDYLGDTAFYCDPADMHSIRNAVLAAYYAPIQRELRPRCMAYTWERSAEALLSAYNSIVRKPETTSTLQTPAASSMTVGSAESSPEFERIISAAEDAAQGKNFSQADELFAQAAKMAPQSVRLHRDRGAVALAQNQFTQARSEFEFVLTAQPDDCRALCGMGMVELSTRGAEVAYPLFVKATKIDQDNLVAIRNLLACAYAIPRFDDLEGALQRYVDRHPEDVEIRFCLAGCWYKQGKFAEAKGAAEWVMKRNPQHRGAGELLDILRKPENSPARAVAPVVDASDATPRPTIRLGEQYSKTEEREALKLKVPAVAATVAAVSPAAGTPENMVAELEELKRARNYQELEKRAQEFLKATGVAPELHERGMTLLGDAMALQGRIDEAERMYDEVLRRNSNSARGLAGKGVVKATRTDWNGARECFQKALAKSPQSDVALSGLGLCSLQAGNVEGAWDYYRQALQVNPENTSALYGLMDVGYRMKRYGPVEQALQNYLELHPADLNFVYCLAGCLYAQEKLDDALSAVETISLFDPTHERAKELRGAIEERRSGQQANGSV